MGYDSIVLASASARRSLLLTQIGVRHRAVAADVDETPRRGEAPDRYVGRLAEDKARAIVHAAGGAPDRPVLAADTTVVLDGHIYGKPADEADCIAMLAALGGRRHAVLTALALWSDGRLRHALSTSHVTFREIGTEESRRYWASGEPAGKAGAYAIQGLASRFVTRINGSYSNVVGLPVALVCGWLDEVCA